MTAPVRKASIAFSSSAHMDAGTAQALGMKTGLSSLARTIACSGVNS